MFVPLDSLCCSDFSDFPGPLCSRGVKDRLGACRMAPGLLSGVFLGSHGLWDLG